MISVPAAMMTILLPADGQLKDPKAAWSCASSQDGATSRRAPTIAAGRSARIGQLARLVNGRPGVSGSASARREDVELVALRVGQARPRHVALAEVNVGGAESPQPGHLGRLIVTGIRPEVEVDAVLHGLHVGRAQEQEVRPDALCGA